MASTADYRKKPFGLTHVKNSGAYLGRKPYSKLYLIENVLRVIIHSVLSAQLNPRWWDSAVDQRIKDQVERFKQDYLLRPWHTKPGRHGIYYTQLKHLSEIIRANRNQLDPLIPDVDQWMTTIEHIRLPRNIVGHMNYPNRADRRLIDVFYDDCVALVKQLQDSKTVPLRIP